MAQRTRILIADQDLNSLSRIYLALLHRNYKVEATNLSEEIADRIKRLKPSLVILSREEFEVFDPPLKTPLIVLGTEEGPTALSPVEIRFLQKNVAVEKLINAIEEMIV